MYCCLAASDAVPLQAFQVSHWRGPRCRRSPWLLSPVVAHGRLRLVEAVDLEQGGVVGALAELASSPRRLLEAGVQDPGHARSARVGKAKRCNSHRDRPGTRPAPGPKIDALPRPLQETPRWSSAAPAPLRPPAGPPPRPTPRTSATPASPAPGPGGRTHEQGGHRLEAAMDSPTNPTMILGVWALRRHHPGSPARNACASGCGPSAASCRSRARTRPAPTGSTTTRTSAGSATWSTHRPARRRGQSEQAARQVRVAALASQPLDHQTRRGSPAIVGLRGRSGARRPHPPLHCRRHRPHRRDDEPGSTMAMPRRAGSPAQPPHTSASHRPRTGR